MRAVSCGHARKHLAGVLLQTCKASAVDTERAEVLGPQGKESIVAWSTGARSGRYLTLPTRPRWPMSTLRLLDAPNARVSHVIYRP